MPDSLFVEASKGLRNVGQEIASGDQENDVLDALTDSANQGNVNAVATLAIKDVLGALEKAGIKAGGAASGANLSATLRTSVASLLETFAKTNLEAATKGQAVPSTIRVTEDDFPPAMKVDLTKLRDGTI